MILKLMKRSLERRIPGCEVCAYQLNTAEAHAAFVVGIQSGMLNQTDIIIMDQHLELQNNGVRLGTEILGLLRKTDTNACFIMHTGNDAQADRVMYANQGAHATIGKGTDIGRGAADAFHRFIAAK